MGEQPRHGGNLVWAAEQAGCAVADLLDFSASINPWGPPAGAIAAIGAALPQMRAYPDPSYRELRSAIAAHHGIDPAWVMPGNGAAELLTWAGRELAQAEWVHLVVPAFGDYGRSLRAFGARVVEHPLVLVPRDSLTGESLPSWFDQSPFGSPQAAPALGPRDAVLLNNPHNPTGWLGTAAQVRSLLETGALVVVDEAFMDFVPPGQQESVIDWVGHYANLVVIRSLTKFYSLPGLRLGYAVSQPERLQRWQSWRDPWPVNCLAEVAAIASLADQEFQRQAWVWLAEARDDLYIKLKALPGMQPFPSAANFLLVRYDSLKPGGYSASQIQRQLLLQHRILIRDCLSFAELGDGYFRVAVRTLAEQQQLAEALAQVLGGCSTEWR